MILVTAFAVLFSFFKVLGVQPEVFACISLFVAGVAACQVLMFKGKNPGRASIIGGYIVGGLIFLGVVVVGIFFRQKLGWYYFDEAVVALLATVVLFGGPFGYLAGCVVAGIFLAWKDRDPDSTTDQSVEPPQAL